MKREIKFRAKALNDNRWRYGHLTECDDFCIIDQSNECYVDDEYSFRGDTHFFRIAGAMCKKDTVSQFTGLYDKNGTKIYEDDIISGTMFFDAFRYVVQWDNARSSYVFKSLTSPCVFLCFSDFSEVEVIGNIFDNPELLNKESLL